MKSIDGYKSYIGFVLFGAGAALKALSPPLHLGLEGIADLMMAVGASLAGIGVAHKLEKLKDKN